MDTLLNTIMQDLGINPADEIKKTYVDMLMERKEKKGPTYEQPIY